MSSCNCSDTLPTIEGLPKPNFKLNSMPVENDCEWCPILKEELKVRDAWVKHTDDEEWAMWIKTRDMRSFLNSFIESLEEIHARLDELENKNLVSGFDRKNIKKGVSFE